MKNPSDVQSELQKILDKIKDELKFVSSGSDANQLPIYALFSDFCSTCTTEQNELKDTASELEKELEQILSKAQPFNTEIITKLNLFTGWADQYFSKEPRGIAPFNLYQRSNISKDSTDSQNEERKKDAPEDSYTDVILEINEDIDNDILSEFHAECLEHLDTIESSLLVLEKSSNSEELIDRLFRSFHTIKGTAGYLHLEPIHKLSHDVESLLDVVRGNKRNLTPKIITLILESKDAIELLVDQITEKMKNGMDPVEIIPIASILEQISYIMNSPEGESSSGGATYDKDLSVNPNIEIASAKKLIKDSRSTIRVKSSKLDSLLETIGELVIVQNQLTEAIRENQETNPDSQKYISQLNRISKTLQTVSMSLRMIPIGPAFQKIGRIIRDLSDALKKDVNIVLTGEDTELDRNIVQLISDPLVHMVRNAIGHGIESAEERIANGKPARGTCDLKAYHQNNSIVIEVTDDGRGIDHEELLKKAIEKNLASEYEKYTKEEIYQFIFLPGFSTAKNVTEVSGRGVGMDVVSRNLQKLRGTISVSSELGKGSTFKLEIPLTLAIIDGLIVKVGKHKFALPSTATEVTIRPTKEQISTIEGESEIINFQGQYYPIIRLSERFSIETDVENLCDSVILIVNGISRKYALAVDKILNKQEIVIKNLGNYLTNVSGIGGSTILGDGTAGLILDPSTLYQKFTKHKN